MFGGEKKQIVDGKCGKLVQKLIPTMPSNKVYAICNYFRLFCWQFRKRFNQKENVDRRTHEYTNLEGRNKSNEIADVYLILLFVREQFYAGVHHCIIKDNHIVFYCFRCSNTHHETNGVTQP